MIVGTTILGDATRLVRGALAPLVDHAPAAGELVAAASRSTTPEVAATGAAALLDAQRGAATGVFRHIVPKATLELDPALKGMLDMPAITPHAAIGVTMLPGDIKVMTVNPHMFVPGGVPLNPVSNEEMGGIRQVAAAVLKEDPDFVVVQELRRRPAGLGLPGIPEQPSVFAHLIGASDMAFTPAVASMPGLHEGYGVAMYARKGAQFTAAVNGRLSNIEEGVERRSVAIVNARLLNGDERTLMGTHFANDDLHRPGGNAPDQQTRDLQAGDIGSFARQVNETGEVTYQSVVDDSTQHASGFARRGVMAGGDWNQSQAQTDRILRPLGMTHVNDALRASGRPGAAARADAADTHTAWFDGISGPPHRVDHWYGDKFVDVVDSGVVEAAPLPSGIPATDHRFSVAVVRSRPEPA
jgi:hypothetical protein